MYQKFYTLLMVLVLNFAYAWAGDLRELEDITVRVLDLDEVPGDGVPLIDLPEPDLGEMRDNMEAINLPGRGAVGQHGGGDIAGRQGPGDLVSPDQGASVPESGTAPTQPIPQNKIL